jgi:DNA-binding response OmpR family regulator
MKRLRGGPGTILCVGDEAVRLNLRCSFLKENGWLVLSSGTAHEGIIRFSEEEVDATILDFGSDGAEAALVAGELKRLRPQVPVIILGPDDTVLPKEVLECADVVVPVSDQSHLLSALRSLQCDLGKS